MADDLLYFNKMELSDNLISVALSLKGPIHPTVRMFLPALS